MEKIGAGILGILTVAWFIAVLVFMIWYVFIAGRHDQEAVLLIVAFGASMRVLLSDKI